MVLPGFSFVCKSKRGMYEEVGLFRLPGRQRFRPVMVADASPESNCPLQGLLDAYEEMKPFAVAFVAILRMRLGTTPCRKAISKDGNTQS